MGERYLCRNAEVYEDSGFAKTDGSWIVKLNIWV